MKQKDIEILAEYYDLGFQSFDIENEGAKQAKSDFYARLESHYSEDCPNEELAFRDYRREAIKKCREWLKKNS